MKTIKRVRLLFTVPARNEDDRRVRVRSSHYAKFRNREWRHEVKRMMRAGEFDALPAKPLSIVYDIW